MKKRTGVLFCIVMLMILIFAMCAGALFYAFAVVPARHGDIVSEATPKTYKTQILDDEGNLIQNLSGEASNREYVELDKIPLNLQHAFVAIEDERFYSHHGVDPKAILRSFLVGIKNGGFSQGGSTITQQLVKNNVLTSWTEEVTFSDKLQRKVDEICLALQLEMRESKDQILQNYLNTINLGGGCWGVQTASRYYFGKDVNDLTLSECAVIAGITQNPTGYNPIANPENNADRREIVLQNMLDQGYISEEAYQEAVNDDIYDRIASMEHHTESEEVMSYFEDALVIDVMNKLKEEYGYDDDKASALVYQGGLTIYSTVDSDLQRICEEEANNEGWYDSDAQISLVMIDQTNGQVKAIVGGRGEKTADLIYNRATDSERQIGSCMKIIGEYAAAIDNGYLTLGSVLEDSPYTYANGTEVFNWDYKFKGRITIRDAIIQSNNIAALRAMDLVGIDAVMESLEDFGITTLNEDDRVETIALGGTTNGLTNLEVTAAYAAIANGGIHHKPALFTKVVDHTGKEILVQDEEENHAVSEETAALLTSAMREVVTLGTGIGCGLDNMPVAGKSGTTNETKDAWFVGFSPYLTMGVWGGYDENVPQESSSFVKNIWHQVMARAHESLSYQDFQMPGGMTYKTICTKCGNLAVSGTCDRSVQGDMTKEELYVIGTAPTEYCDCHELVTVCKDTGMKANFFCSFAGKETCAYLKTAVPGTEEENYLLNNELAYQPCTKHDSVWNKLFGNDADDDEEEDHHDQSDDYYDYDHNNEYDHGNGNGNGNGHGNGNHNGNSHFDEDGYEVFDEDSEEYQYYYQDPDGDNFWNQWFRF